MRETTPLWTFQGGASPSSLSMSLDGKFAGVGHKNGLTFLNESGRPVWNNKKIRRVRDISVSTRTGLMSIASDQKVLYLVDKGGKIRWHRELQSKAVSTSISSRGTTIVSPASIVLEALLKKPPDEARLTIEPLGLIIYMLFSSAKSFNPPLNAI